MQVSTAIVLYLVGGLIVSMPDVYERTLRLVPAPFVYAAGHLARYATRTLVAMTVFLAAETLALICGNHSFRPTKLFAATVALLALSTSDSGELRLAVAFASLAWTLCRAVMVLASIARNRSCCATTYDDPQPETHESAAPDADSRILPNGVVPRMQPTAAPASEVPVPDVSPSNVARSTGSSSVENSANEDIMDSSISPVEAVQIDLTGLFFDFDVTTDGRLVVLIEGPLMDYCPDFPTHIAVICTDDGTPVDVVLVAADDGVLRVDLSAYLCVPRLDLRDLDLEPLMQLLQSYGMRRAKDEVLPRGDASASSRHRDVQLLYVVIHHV